MRRKLASLITMVLIFGFAVSASALVIDNDITSDTLGHWSVDVLSGGESRDADLTANRKASADVFTEDVLFDYFSYVDVGSGGQRLSGTSPISAGVNAVSSNGSFTGSGGNDINWSVVSSIAGGESVFRSEFTFTAVTGSLGSLRFFQYLDEDLEDVDDDVFFTRGSVAGNDLELFTVDNTEVYGVSHSGALSEGQGLVNASFAGWAADEFDTMRPAITDGTQAVSPTGVINNLDDILHPDVGAAFGPNDIVSVLAWDIGPDATAATIITTLGGVPDFSEIPPPDGQVPVPEPGTILLVGMGLLGLAGFRKKKK